MADATKIDETERDAPGIKEILANVVSHLEESAQASREAKTAFESLKSEVHALDDKYEARFDQLEARIDGSKRPPPGAAPLVRIIDAVDKKADAAGARAAATQSQHDLDVPALRAELAEVKAELRQQSNVMGIGKSWLPWLFSARGLKAAVQIATLAGALYAAFYAAAHPATAAPPTPMLPAPSGSR